MMETRYASVAPSSGDKAPVYDVDSDDANVLGNLAADIVVEVGESIDGWTHITYKGHSGYMRDEDLNFAGGTAQAA